MKHRMLLPLAAVVLSSCASNFSARVDDTQLKTLSQDNTGIVLMHSSLHETCTGILATLATRDASGRFVQTQKITLKGLVDFQALPSQIVLPAGTHGIVGLECSAYRRQERYTTPMAQRGSILDNTGAVYEQPIATFTVSAGEVVDIGSLRLPTRANPNPSWTRPRRLFVAVVTPTPEQLLQNLAASNPALAAARVTRHMVPASPPRPGGA